MKLVDLELEVAYILDNLNVDLLYDNCLHIKEYSGGIVILNPMPIIMHRILSEILKGSYYRRHSFIKFNLMYYMYDVKNIS